MIELAPNTAFMIYLSLTLTLLLGLWAYQHFRSKGTPRITPPQHLYICEYCHFAYLDESDKPVTQCPQCKTFNKDNIHNTKT